MVNTADVKALLLRLHQETKTGTGNSDMVSGMSFASSLGAEIDAAAEEQGLQLKASDTSGKSSPLQADDTGVSQSKDELLPPALKKDVADSLAHAALPVVEDEQEQKGRVIVIAQDGNDAKATLDAMDHEADAAVSSAATDRRPSTAHGKPKARPGANGENEIAGCVGAPAVAGMGPSVIDPAQMAQMQILVAQQVSGPPASSVAEATAMKLSLPEERQGSSATNTMVSKTVSTRPATPLGGTRLAFHGSTKPSRTASTDHVAAKTGTEDEAETGADLSGRVPLHVSERQEAGKIPTHAHDATATSTLPLTGLGAGATGHEPSQAAMKDIAEFSGQMHSSSGTTIQGLEVRPDAVIPGDRVIAATPTTLEVGLANGTHGWLKIRAELTDNGTVTAALSSSSTAGTDMLHRSLPSLSNFLDQEKVQVSSLVVHQSAESSGLLAGEDRGSGGGGQSPQDSGGQGERDQRAEMPIHESPGSLDAALELQTSGLQQAAGRGWLSVRV
jgi:hypothetical protein